MNEPTDTSELPVFPASAPDVMSDPVATTAFIEQTLEQLASVIDLPADQLSGPTPCGDFSVSELRDHILAWLQFFAAALSDPTGATTRIDTETWQLPEGVSASSVVAQASSDITAAIAGGVAGDLVVMSEARMAGDCVLAMAIGEYLVHSWDLAVAIGQPFTPNQAAAAVGLEFLRSTVVPEYRGPDSGFFDEEVPVPDGASTFEQLLCFAGRHPEWTPPSAPPAK